jgi:hypothetical protein
VITAVEPGTGIAGVAIDLTIRGSGFTLPFRTDLGGSSPGPIELTAAIGSVALEGVRLDPAGAVTGTLPPTLPPGLYGVTLRFPDGRAATLAAAYRAEPPIEATLAVDPAELAQGTQAGVTLTVTSHAGADVELVPGSAAAMPAGALAVALALAALPASLAPGASATVGGTLQGLAWPTGADGEVTATVGWKLAELTDAVAAQATVHLLGPGRLVVDATAPPVLTFDQATVIAVHVSNAGDAPVRSVTLAVSDQSATPGLVTVGAPVPALIDELAPGAGQNVTVPIVAGGAPGPVSLAITAAGLDANGAGPVASDARTVDLAVQAPGEVTLAADLTPAQVSAGQVVTFTLTVTNTGQAGINVMDLPPPTASPTGTALLTQVTSPVFTPGEAVAGGGSVSYAWTYVSTGSGAVTLTGSLQAQDGSGALITPVDASASTLVQRPAELRVAVAVTPSPVTLGDGLTVAVNVFNDGEAAAEAVEPTSFDADATAVAAGARTPAGPLAVPGGGSGVFYYPFTAQTLGTFTARSAARGRDANSAAALSAPLAASDAVAIVASQPPQVVITSPAPGATVAPGGEVAVEVGALADMGRSIADVALAAAGPGAVAAPSSVSTTGRGTGATFLVRADAAASDGAVVTLTAVAHDDAGTPAASAPLTVTVRSSPTLVAVTCTPASLPMFLGHPEEVRLTATWSDGTERDVSVEATWSSSNGAVVGVTEGIVTPGAVGTAVLTGSFGGLGGACTAEVSNRTYFTSPERVLVATGATAPLQFFRVGNPAPTDLTSDPGTAWSTSAPELAQVSPAGVVTAVADGRATITACNTATNKCASTQVLVGVDVEVPGALGPGSIGIAGAQHFGSLAVRAGADLFAYGPAPLDLSVDSRLTIEAGATLRADGANAPDASAQAPKVPLRGEGGDGGPGGGGGGAGAGDGSLLCSGENCGGAGAPPGANACKNASCPGGDGGGPGAGGGAPATGPSNAGGGGGHLGAGGRGGGATAGTFAGAAGAAAGATPQGGGSGGGGGTGGSGSAPGGGGGGGGGVIRVTALGTAVIRVDGRLTARGGDGGSLRTGSSRGPGGGGAGGRITLTAAGGSIEGAGLVSAAGGVGGGPSDAAAQCGGGGGGGGGAITLDAPVKGPFLMLVAPGGAGGPACLGGGQPGEPGSRGRVTR